MVLQTNYSDEIAPGLPGMIANSEKPNIISRTVESATLGFGQLSLRGDGDHGCLAASAEILESAAPVADAGNTGNGTFAATPVISSGAKPGVYRLEIENAAANAGGFIVEDPEGNEVGAGTVGVAFSARGVAFTLQDGAADFVRGDGFTFVVAPSGATEVGNVLGVSRRDTTVGAETDTYTLGDTAAIITRGQVWVTAGGALGPNSAVYYNVSTDRFVAAAGANVIGPFDKMEFDDTAAANGDLVRLSINLRLAL